MIIDSGGRVFVLSTDLQPPATRLAKGNGGDDDIEGGSDAFVAALRNTAQTGPLVQKLLKAVNDEVGKWGDRMVEWQQSVISFLDERENAAETALSLSPTIPTCSLLPPYVPQSLRYKLTRSDSDKARRGNGDGSSVGERKALEFLAENQWVLLRDFLISCCDPVCRTEVFNEYRVSSSSLSAAEAEGRYTVSDIRNVIIYFSAISASRNLATGERGPLVGRLPPRLSDASPSAAAATEEAQHLTLSQVEDSLYAISPLSAFDSVMYSALATSLAVSGGSGSVMLCTSSSVSNPFGASSPQHGGAAAVGQHAVTLLQRHVIVGRGGQRAPSSFSLSPTAIGGGSGLLSGALALTAIFVPRPIEATLHAQGKDGRLKIVLRRKAGLWHQLLAEDEAWEASASRNAHSSNKKTASSFSSPAAMPYRSSTTIAHHHQQTFLSTFATSVGNSTSFSSHPPPSSSALTKQLATDLPPPPLRNYLCCSSRVYLEYLVGQMRFLFNPVILASAKDLASSSPSSASPSGAAATQHQHQHYHLYNNNSISNLHHQHSGVGQHQSHEEDDLDIDIGDLFGEDDAVHRHVQQSHAQQQQQRVSGLQRLLALLGGKVAPQLVFSDVEGRASGGDAAELGGGESTRVSGTVLSESAQASLDGRMVGRSAPQTRSAVHDSAVLTSRLDQLVSCDSLLSHQPLSDSSSHLDLDPTDRLRVIKNRLRGAGSAHQQNNAYRSYTPTSTHPQHTAITAGIDNNRSAAGAGAIVYCAEIKPNALRELRAILHDRYGINVDCYFDFMSEEEGYASSVKTTKPSSTGGNAEVGKDRGEMAVCNFKLKPGVALRPYQKASLERFCQDERKVFQQQDSNTSTTNDGEEDGDNDNAIPATNNKSTASTAEEIARKAQAEEDAYNASLTTTRANTSNKTDSAIPSLPTRRIAHHGIVVLPCGAGKTLTGIAASAMVGRRTIVMCINVLSVLQWRDQFLKWTCLRPDQVTVCTRDLKQIPSDVFITTYSMLTAQQPVNGSTFKKRGGKGGDVGTIETENSRLKKRIMEEISNTAWGMLVLDEVHVAPASCFQTVVDKVKYHCVLGLSATLLREDMGIDKLRYLVGPKLYEANWLELTRAGNLAPVMCAEVRCPLPSSMLKQYLMHRGGYAAEARQVMALERGQMRRQRPLIGEHAASDEEGGEGPTSGSRRIQVDIECINPFKLWCTQALVAFHESRTPPDKTIIFCDSVPAAHYYARKLGIPFMDRSARDTERSNMLKYFTHSKYLNTIILTRVGDIALDLPEATVVIQISGLFASQRQEAQRLGRILRPKPPSLDHGMSFFYSLVSDDTAEVEAAVNRQAWLRDQGYTYRMLKCEEILAHYRVCRQAFVRNALPHAAPSSGPTMNGPIGIASPFSRPLACVGGPVWYYRIPVHVAIVRVSVAANNTATTTQSSLANGGRGVLRLNLKRSREDDTAKETEEASTAANTSSLTSRSVTTSTRWMWVSFSSQNSLVLERSFVLGHYNRDAKLRLYPVASSSSKGGTANALGGPLADLPDHPPLRLVSVESVPLPMAIRTVTTTLPDTTTVLSSQSSSSSACRWEAMGVLQSCQGPVTKPRAGEFSSADAEQASKCKGGWGKKKLSAATTSPGHHATDGSKSAAIDGSGGFVYFDTSDVPSSHGEWIVTVIDPSVGGEAASSSSSKGSSKGGSGSSVATAKVGIIKLLSCDGASPLSSSVPANGARKGSATAQKTMVLALRIRRGRGPVEVHEPDELFGEGASDDSSILARMLNEDTANIRGGMGAAEVKQEVKQEERKLVGSSSISQEDPLTRRPLPTPKAFPLVDLEADYSVEWNSHYAFGDSLGSLGVSTASRTSSVGENTCGVGGVAADEHDCCLPAGGLRRLPCGRPLNVHGLLAKSLSLEDAHLSNMHGEGVEGEDSHLHSHSCVQHFTHTEVGHRKGK